MIDLLIFYVMIAVAVTGLGTMCFIGEYVYDRRSEVLRPFAQMILLGWAWFVLVVIAVVCYGRPVFTTLTSYAFGKKGRDEN